ncbi:MAG: TlpA family protein disulfide reductase [Chloroflexi bacterium]|nr:TlpA family protein disulfide reductase [Chloroflexota bacterium]
MQIRIKQLAFATAIAVVLLLGTLFAFGLRTSASGPLSEGAAPDFAFKPFDGAPLKLSDLRGKVVVANIWASWCIPCKDEAPLLERTWRAYRERGVVFLGVDYVDTESAARAFIKQFDITYLNGPDTASTISRAFRARGVPETYFIDRRGVIARTVIGPITESDLRNTLESLLADRR